MARPLPASTDVEAMVLGAILIDPGAIDVVSGSITQDDLALPAHRTIFDAMRAIASRGEEVSEMAVVERLRSEGSLASVGGKEKILSLTEGLHRLASLDSHLDIIRQQSIRRAMIRTGEEIAEIAYKVPDIDEATDKAQSLALSIGRSGQSELVYASQVISQAGGVDGLLSSKPGRRTGFVDLDRKLNGGLAPGELVILAARPAMGKTSLALNIAVNFAQRGETVPVFSLEMGKDAIVSRMLSSLAGRSIGELREDESEAKAVAEKLATMPLAIDDGGSVSPASVISKCRTLKAKAKGLGLIVVDYLQLMSGGGRAENRNLELSSITRALKLAAMELDAPVLVISQLNRDVEKRADNRPMLADLRDSGAIEQDADKILFLFRRGVYEPDYASDMTTEAIVAKHRNGPVGAISLTFDGQYTRFRSLTRRVDDDDAPF